MAEASPKYPEALVKAPNSRCVAGTRQFGAGMR